MVNGDSEQTWYERIASQIANAIIDAVSGLLGGIIRLIRPGIREAYEEASEMTEIIVNSVDAALFEALGETFGLSASDVRGLFKFPKAPFPLSIFYNLVVMIATYGQYLMQSSQVLNMENVQNLLSATAKQLPREEFLLNAAFVAPEKTAEIRNALKKYGYSDEMIDLHFISRYRLYNEETIRELYLRKVLDADQMFMRMRELGYTDTRIHEIIQSWEVIPGPQDLFTMVAKEAFEPDMVSTIGLGDEFPEDQVEWLQKQGISKDWAIKYWYAHWDQPSIQMGFEMLHRGVIDFATLDMLFRAIEMPPFWRDKLTQIAYTPYTRVDVRRMHDMGVLNDQDLIQAYKDLGYDDDKAYNMAVFTLRYNEQNDRDLTKSQITKAYINGLMNKTDAIELLKKINFPEAQAEFIIALEEYDRDIEYQEASIKNIGERYVNRLLTESEARVRLNSMNLPSTRITLLIDRWKIDLYEDQKLPSKSDLGKMLKNKVINDDQYLRQMDLLGYNFQYANWFLKLAKKGVT